MKRTTRSILSAIAACALSSTLITSLQAATILKLDLGGVGPDIHQDGGGQLGTISDGTPATTGDQNTNIEYTGFLDPLFADVTTGDASFTISGPLIANPTPSAIIPGTPQVVIQGYPSLGNLPTFSLYGPGNTLLLTGPTGSAVLTGTLGAPGTGGVFFTQLETVTGGTLAPYLAPHSVSLSISLSNVNGGNGFSLFPPEAIDLNPWVADGFVTISADAIPEPASVLLIAVGTALAGGISRRLRR
ncbi:MAG TPA: PEP-CTERM sorting domain-containing protein [Lacipirellulaceae bacterium]|jgi:hypothetical protein|nr:PEP-CTERM sorting domain-containing protein [Lacipirellulaceae bacterium]